MTFPPHFSSVPMITNIAAENKEKQKVLT